MARGEVWGARGRRSTPSVGRDGRGTVAVPIEEDTMSDHAHDAETSAADEQHAGSSDKPEQADEATTAHTLDDDGTPVDNPSGG